MAFRWKAEKSSRSNLRRLARGQLRAAIDEVSDPFIDPADAVHDARLRVKKARCLLRLVRGAAPAEFRRQNAILHDAAHALAVERDRQAVIESLDKLLAHADCNWNESSGRLQTLGELRDSIATAREQASDGRLREELVRQVADRLQSALAGLKRWTAAAKGEEVVVAGFADGYRRARRALEDVLDDATPTRLHEWRKQVKYHRYQVRLFQRAWPALLEARCEELKRLTDLLGDDHDLVLVRQTLEQSAAEPRDGAADLLDLLERRRAELQAEAIPLGRLLFAEKARRLTRRIRQYWRVYRNRRVH